MPLALRISHTVDAATLAPRPASSPWILRYPHSGFSLASRRTRALMFRPSGGGRCRGASAGSCPPLSGAGELDLDVAAGQPVADASVKEAATRGRRACGAVYERTPAQRVLRK